MNNNSKNGSRATPKMGMVSELKKGTKFVHPVTEELVFVNYKDEDCLGIGPSQGFTNGYIRKGDELWNKPVEIK